MKLSDVMAMLENREGRGRVFVECLIFSSGNMGSPVSHWDGKRISAYDYAGNEAYGDCSRELRQILLDDMVPGSDCMTPIEYDD